MLGLTGVIALLTKLRRAAFNSPQLRCASSRVAAASSVNARVAASSRVTCPRGCRHGTCIGHADPDSGNRNKWA